MNFRFPCFALVAVLACSASSAMAAPVAYPMPNPPSVLLAADDATFAPFATAVGTDVDAALQDSTQSSAKRTELLRTKLALQLLAHDAAGARASIAAIRALQTDPAFQITYGRAYLVYLDAPTAFAEADQKSVDALPWSVVHAAVEEAYIGEKVVTRDTIVSYVKNNLDPIAAKTGSLEAAQARELVRIRMQLLVAFPLFAQDAKVLKAYIGRHAVAKPDIWQRRDVTLTPAQVRAPVAIGIWDSGVDPSLYPGAMFVDGSKRHGIAFTSAGAPSSDYLLPLPPTVSAKYPRFASLASGVTDAQRGLDSPDADAARSFMTSLSAAQGAAFARDFAAIIEYAHGSYVAGIAAHGNPGAKLVVARFRDDLPNLPFAPTPEWAARMAANFASMGAYFRAHNVRVVNMSWADSDSEFEQWLAKTEPADDPQTRSRKAQDLYATWRGGIENVIKTTPGTLFVARAGTGAAAASGAAEIPAALSYPNLITVGSVNQTGEASKFTVDGPTVAVYANGYHIASKIPGGYTVKLSGPSMAAPAVTNLAAKLFALDPALTAIQVRALIVNGATPDADGKRLLIDPKRSIALLSKT